MESDSRAFPVPALMLEHLYQNQQLSKHVPACSSSAHNGRAMRTVHKQLAHSNTANTGDEAESCGAPGRWLHYSTRFDHLLVAIQKCDLYDNVGVIE